MKIPVIVTFDGIESSEAVGKRVRIYAARLNKYFERMTSCRVIIACPHQHQRHGKLYSVRIDLTVPEAEIVINKEHDLDHSHEDVYVAIRDSFHAARRRVEDYARKLRSQVKNHKKLPHGRVTKLCPEESYGFIETSDGREVYFHRDSVLKKQFPKLHLGDSVSFLEEPGMKGANATSVQLVHRRRQHRSWQHAVSSERKSRVRAAKKEVSRVRARTNE